jgi:hypothetical protein
MTALAADRDTRRQVANNISVPATADIYYTGALVCWDTSVQRVVVGQESLTIDPIGIVPYQQTVATNGDPLVVELAQETRMVWYANSSGGDEITASHYGENVFIADDQTVAATDNSGARSVAGRCWEVDSVLGVRVALINGANDVDTVWVLSTAGAAAGSIADAGTLITATTIEGAFQEIAADVDELEAGEVLQVRTVQITTTELTASATSQAINVGAALPANAVVMAHEINLATVFSGGGATSCTVDIGGTDADAIVDGHDIFTGATTGRLSGSTLGVHWCGVFTAEQLTATVTSDVDVDTLAAGDVTITVWFLLPTD